VHRLPPGDDLLLHNRSTTAAAGPGGQWGRTAASSTTTSASLITPKRSQFDLQVEGLFGFTGPGSIVRVREFETEGAGLHFSNGGMNTEQMPTLDARYWFDEVNAIHLRFRYFNLGGTHFSSSPIKFNGAIIPGGRTNNFDGWPADYTTSAGRRHCMRAMKRVGRLCSRDRTGPEIGIDYSF